MVDKINHKDMKTPRKNIRGIFGCAALRSDHLDRFKPSKFVFFFANLEERITQPLWARCIFRQGFDRLNLPAQPTSSTYHLRTSRAPMQYSVFKVPENAARKATSLAKVLLHPGIAYERIAWSYPQFCQNLNLRKGSTSEGSDLAMADVILERLFS